MRSLLPLLLPLLLSLSTLVSTSPLPLLDLSPLPTSPPSPFLQPRNNAGVPSTAVGVTRERQGASLSTISTATSSTPTSSQTTTFSGPGSSYTSFFGNGIPSSFLTWIAIVIVLGIVTSLLCARYFYIKRFGPPTFRSYFIPPSGVHFPLLRIHINGPPPRPPRESPPSYMFASRQRQRRRDRRTVGEGIGEGGARLGERDVDDDVDEEGRVRERHEGEGEGLPKYEVDHGLPLYGTVEGERGVVDGGGREPTTMATTEAAQATSAEEQLPSVMEYEMASRAARQGGSTTTTDAPITATTDSTPTYPPIAHLSNSSSSSHEAEPNVVSRPVHRRQSGDRTSTYTEASSSHTKVEDLEGKEGVELEEMGTVASRKEEDDDVDEEDGKAETETQMIERSRDA